MKSRLLPFATLALMAIALSSCTHTSPFKEEYAFQAMGSDAEIVITADVRSLRENKPSLIGYDDPLLKELASRSDRVSISIDGRNDQGEDGYPLLLEDTSYYGVLEGNYPKSMNLLLSFNDSFEKVKEDGVKFYRNEVVPLEVKSPKGGLVIFSSDDYPTAEKRVLTERTIYISPDIASKIGEGVFGLYTKNPETMIDLGLGITLSVIEKMDEAVLYVVLEDGAFRLYADISMDEERQAKTLNTLLRNRVIADYRVRGERPDYKGLAEIYSVEGAVVHVRGREMSDGEVKNLLDKVTSLS